MKADAYHAEHRLAHHIVNRIDTTMHNTLPNQSTKDEQMLSLDVAPSAATDGLLEPQIEQSGRTLNRLLQL